MQEGKLYKQVDEKHLYTEVDLMLWSPRMDLVAVTTSSGEVILHRLSWQKVWLLSPPKEGVLVSSMVWRPDGRVLAVGYVNGTLKLCSVEKAQKLYEHGRFSGHSITSLSWCDDRRYEHECTPDELSYHFKPDMNGTFRDNSNVYLPSLPPLNPKSSGGDKSSDTSLLKDQEGLNILLVGNAVGELEMLAFGFVLIAKIVVPGARPMKVLNTVLSAKMNSLSVLSSEGEDSKLNLTTYSCRGLNSNKEEIKFLAMKLGKIMELESYLSETLKQMNEVYEDILFEFETKMRRYAEEKKNKNGWTLRTELIKFFLYGTASDDLKCFLQFELKKQSLNRLGSSVQSSYGHIKKLIIQNLYSVCEAIIFHLEKLDGMSKVQHQFGRLGLNESRVSAVVLQATNLLLKSNEMLQVIDDTVVRFNAFFRWFYPAKLRLSGESVPHGAAEYSNRDTKLIVDFIQEYFKPNVRLERVGQYLKDEELIDPINDPGNLWRSFMESASDGFKESTKDFLPDVHSRFSLIQVAKKFQSSLDDLVRGCSLSVQEFFQLQSTLRLVGVADFGGPTSSSRRDGFFASSCADDLGSSSFVLLPRTIPIGQCFYIIKNIPLARTTSVESISFVSDMSRRMEIIDVAFYDDKTLCVLYHDDEEELDSTGGAGGCFQHRGSSKIVHLNLLELDQPPERPTKVLISTESDGEARILRAPVDLRLRLLTADSKFREDVIRVVDNSRASQFAISGERKVACVLYSSRKRVRLFLTEWEDDGDASASMQVDETARPLEDGNEDYDVVEADGTGGLDIDSTLRVSDITIDSPDDNDKENSVVVV